MEHVAIAWSGVLFPLILVFGIWRCFSLGRKCLSGRNSLAGGNHLPGREAFLRRESGEASLWDYLPLVLSFLVIMAFSLLSFVDALADWRKLLYFMGKFWPAAMFSGGSIQDEKSSRGKCSYEFIKRSNFGKGMLGRNPQEERLQEEKAQKYLMKTNTAGSKGAALLLKIFAFSPLLSCSISYYHHHQLGRGSGLHPHWLG